jgi:RNA polymerase primary sigma factor
MNDEGFALFLQRIGRTPLLTAAEERALAFRVERGDLAAKDRMIEANLRLVVHVAKRYVRDNSPLTLGDLVQEGTLGLVRAVEKFDPRTGNRFSTYATIWIQQAIGKAVAEKSRTIRVPVGVHQKINKLDRLTSQLGREPEPEEAARLLGWTVEAVEAVRAARHAMVSLDEPVGDTGVVLGALLAAENDDPMDAIDDGTLAVLLGSLDARERRILQLRYGLGGGEAETQVETARRLRMRRGEVRRLEEYALRKLRLAPGISALAAA